MLKSLRNKAKSIAFLVVSFLFANTTKAQQGIISNEDCRVNGNCQLNDLVQIGVNVTDWILKLSGAMALLAFVVGGLMMIISGGNSEMVQKGKNSIKAAVIGIIIVLVAYTIIDFTLKYLGYNDAFGAWNQTN